VTQKGWLGPLAKRLRKCSNWPVRPDTCTEQSINSVVAPTSCLAPINDRMLIRACAARIPRAYDF
jgi:hypothetical protein